MVNYLKKKRKKAMYVMYMFLFKINLIKFLIN